MLREKYENGEVAPEVFEVEESLEKNRISNISTVGLSPEWGEYLFISIHFILDA